SPIEHPSFTFAIEGISRACSHQLVRHRLASYSQQSQRYVSERSDTSGQRSEIKDTFDYVIPPSIKEDPQARGLFERFMVEAQKTYDLLVERLAERGIKGEAANQDARFVLPNAAETKIIVTMNARELLHFFRQRCCYRAQWEIRAMARQMLFLVKEVAPTIFRKAGPPCVSARCPEGTMYCGKAKEIKKIYGSFGGKPMNFQKRERSSNKQKRLFQE
ncbi:MAG: FAD-dependent thymidylate synthase, partial [Thermodesulfovibrionales bacterium]